MRPSTIAGVAAAAAAGVSATLRIASALAVVEYTPELLAIQLAAANATGGGGSAIATVTNGGVANIVSDTSIDLASNAETQALRQFASHKNLRIIYTVAEVAYRLVVRVPTGGSAGATTLASLRGKRIGTMPGTSAAYFVERLLQEAGGLGPSDYSVVSGGTCNAAPCGAGSLPYMLAHGTIDAAGMWEPTMQLVLEATAAAGVATTTFQNASIYSEIFNLHSTADKLANPTTRAAIVSFLRALDQADAQFRQAGHSPDAAQSKDIFNLVARNVAGFNNNASLVRAIWPVHNWAGDLRPDHVLDVLAAEDAWVARTDRRSANSREVLATMIDASVLADARK